MSTYYQYQDVKLMIAYKLMSMEGWNVYGYSPDTSDSMTDYYSPAHWSGIAEKNGYVLCVDVYSASKEQEIREYNYSGFTYDSNITDKIEKLSQMTLTRGASAQEESSAKMMIERLQKKAETENSNANKYVVVGMIPAHMAHPPRCNWHIEKDGMIIEKGTGLLKYTSIKDYYLSDNGLNNYLDFKALGAVAWELKHSNYLLNHSYHYNTKEEADKGAKYAREALEKNASLIENFEAFIRKIDTTCGGLLGEGDGSSYEKVIVTEYKKELKAFDTTTGSIKEGQLFKLKSNFNYGHNKGQIFRIHERDYSGNKSYYAYKLNGKNTKECTGKADTSNRWNTFGTKFLKWIEEGTITWCELQEVTVPYDVEKTVKKKIVSNKNPKTSNCKKGLDEIVFDFSKLNFNIIKDVDTRTNETIYLLKIITKLSKEEYLQANTYINSIGGYYSKFKHAFLFKKDPSLILKGTPNESDLQSENKETQPEPESVEDKKNNLLNIIQITEDTSSQKGPIVWLVTLNKEVGKSEFLQIKQKFATIQGFFSSTKNSFIFKYEPSTKIQEL